MLISELPFLRDEWHPVAEAATVTGPGTITLFGEQYVLWPTGEQGDDAFALADPFCPHRSAHLAGGWVEGGELVCPYHGWRFDGAGRCTLIPQLDPGTPSPPKARLGTYPVAVRYGMVWTCIGASPVSPEPPRWVEGDEAEERGWRVHVEFFERWRVSALRIIDNNLDASHVAYVHRGTFGDPDQARLPSIEVEPTTSGGFLARLSTTQKGISVQNGIAEDEAVRIDRTTETELLRPLTSRTRNFFFGAGPDYSFFGAATPVDDEHSYYLRLTALAGSEAEQPWERFHAFGTRVKEEDRVILESTAADFPIDVTSEVHVRTDKLTLEYRRYLARFLAPATPVAIPVKESA